MSKRQDFPREDISRVPSYRTRHLPVRVPEIGRGLLAYLDRHYRGAYAIGRWEEDSRYICVAPEATAQILHRIFDAVFGRATVTVSLAPGDRFIDLRFMMSGGVRLSEDVKAQLLLCAGAAGYDLFFSEEKDGDCVTFSAFAAKDTDFSVFVRGEDFLSILEE